VQQNHGAVGAGAVKKGQIVKKNSYPVYFVLNFAKKAIFVVFYYVVSPAPVVVNLEIG
jgi:hypothetical protein